MYQIVIWMVIYILEYSRLIFDLFFTGVKYYGILYSIIFLGYAGKDIKKFFSYIPEYSRHFMYYISRCVILWNIIIQNICLARQKLEKVWNILEYN